MQTLDQSMSDEGYNIVGCLGTLYNTILRELMARKEKNNEVWVTYRWKKNQPIRKTTGSSSTQEGITFTCDLCGQECSPD